MTEVRIPCRMTGPVLGRNARRGHKHIFGMGGFQSFSMRRVERLAFRHTLINDERCGRFWWPDAAKVTNRPGCVDATRPGVTKPDHRPGGKPTRLPIIITGDANREHAWKNMTCVVKPAS